MTGKRIRIQECFYAFLQTARRHKNCTFFFGKCLEIIYIIYNLHNSTNEQDTHLISIDHSSNDLLYWTQILHPTYIYTSSRCAKSICSITFQSNSQQRNKICHMRKLLDRQLLHKYIYITVLDMPNLLVRILFSKREEGNWEVWHKCKFVRSLVTAYMYIFLRIFCSIFTTALSIYILRMLILYRGYIWMSLDSLIYSAKEINQNNI